MARSSFDRVRKHLAQKKSETPAPEELREDVEMLVRRCDEVRSLGQGFGGVELSPYMMSLLRVSSWETSAGARTLAEPSSAVVGV